MSANQPITAATVMVVAIGGSSVKGSGHHRILHRLGARTPGRESCIPQDAALFASGWNILNIVDFDM